MTWSMLSSSVKGKCDCEERGCCCSVLCLEQLEKSKNDIEWQEEALSLLVVYDNEEDVLEADMHE